MMFHFQATVYFFYKALRNVLHPWDSPGKNTGVGCHFLLRDLPDQGSSRGLPPCRQTLYPPSHQGSSRNVYLDCAYFLAMWLNATCFQNLAEFCPVLYFYSVEIFKEDLENLEF